MSLLAPVEEEPPHLRRRPVVQDPVEGEEYVIDAILAHRKGAAERVRIPSVLAGWDGNVKAGGPFSKC